FFSSRRRHARFSRDWSSDVCSSDLLWTIRTETNTPNSGGGPIGAPNRPSMDPARFGSGNDPLFADDRDDDLAFSGSRVAFQKKEIGRGSCRERVESVGVRASVHSTV